MLLSENVLRRPNLSSRQVFTNLSVIQPLLSVLANLQWRKLFVLGVEHLLVLQDFYVLLLSHFLLYELLVLLLVVEMLLEIHVVNHLLTFDSFH